MPNVKCVNADCPEVDLPKGNPSDYPVEDILCGECGQPVEATDAEPDYGAQE